MKNENANISTHLVFYSNLLLTHDLLDNYIYNFCVMNPHFLKNKFSNENNLLIKAKFDWLALFKEWKNV
jgi:hypothetical protein